MTPICFKCTQFCKEALDFSLECIQFLQNDFFKQRYTCITFNAIISDQDRIHPNTHLCRTFLLGIYIHWANVKDDVPRDFHRHTHLSWWYSCMSALSVSRTFLGMKCILVNTFSCLGNSFSPDDDHRKRQELY